MLINIDHKALEHACQCAGRSVHHFDRMGDDLPLRASIIAHARAIEQHETDIADLQAEYDEVCKLFEAFKREVSDAIDSSVLTPETEALLSRFIIAKPDPLVEVLQEISGEGGYDNYDHYAYRLQSAIEARGGRIVWEGE